MPNTRLQKERKDERYYLPAPTCQYLPHLFTNLPAELRNDIYALVLSGHTVHVFVDGDNLVMTRPCLAAEADAHAVSIINNATVQTEVVNFLTRHASACNGWNEFDPASGMRLAIGPRQPSKEFNEKPSWYSGILPFLSAHKFFYNEAKGLPFALNTFVFGSADQFTRFKMLLNPFQRDNLTSIVLNCGLKHLTVFYKAARKGNPKATIKSYVQGHRKKLSKVQDEFHGGKIRNVEVCVMLVREDADLADPGLFGAVNSALKKRVITANSKTYLTASTWSGAYERRRFHLHRERARGGGAGTRKLPQAVLCDEESRLGGLVYRRQSQTLQNSE